MPQKRIPLEPAQIYHIWTHANGDEKGMRWFSSKKAFLQVHQDLNPRKVVSVFEE